MADSEIIRVLRIVEYTGPREWVEKTLKTSLPKEHSFGKSCIIRTATIGTFPEILTEENKWPITTKE